MKLGRLIEPLDTVVGVADRLRARFVSAFLLVALPSAAFSTFLWLTSLERAATAADVFIVVGGNGGLWVGYLLSRTRRFRTAAGLAEGVILAGCWGMALQEADTSQAVFTLQFSVVAVVIAGATMSPRAALGIGLANLAVCAAVVWFAPQIGVADAQGAMGLMVFVTGLAITSAALAERDQHALLSRSDELRSSEERLRYSTLHDTP